MTRTLQDRLIDHIDQAKADAAALDAAGSSCLARVRLNDAAYLSHVLHGRVIAPALNIYALAAARRRFAAA